MVGMEMSQQNGLDFSRRKAGKKNVSGATFPRIDDIQVSAGDDRNAWADPFHIGQRGSRSAQDGVKPVIPLDVQPGHLLSDNMFGDSRQDWPGENQQAQQQNNDQRNHDDGFFISENIRHASTFLRSFLLFLFHQSHHSLGDFSAGILILAGDKVSVESPLACLRRIS